jgi:hypothetical protein
VVTALPPPLQKYHSQKYCSKINKKTHKSALKIIAVLYRIIGSGVE